MAELHVLLLCCSEVYRTAMRGSIPEAWCRQPLAQTLQAL